MKSEKRKNIYLESIIENSPISIIAVDISGKVALWNKAAEKTFGWKRSEIIGKPNPIIPKNRKEEYEELLTKSLKGENVIDFHTVRKCKNGADIHVSISVNTWKDEEGNVIGGIAQMIDITDKILAEKSLLESEKRFRNAIILSPMPIMIHDEDDNVIQLSSGWTKYSGYTIEDIPTLGDWTEKAYGNRSGLEKEYIDNLFRIKETANNGEWNVKCKNGDIRIWEFFTTPLGISADGKKVLLSVAFDLTGKKKAEEDLRKSEERFRNIFEDNIAPMFLIDPDNGNLVVVNDAAVKYYGWKRDEMLRMNINQINTLSSGEIKKEMENARNLRRVYFEFQHKQADGSVKDVEVFASKIQLNGKDFLHSIIHDITDRKKAETQLRDREFWLLKSQRVGGLGSYIFDIKNNNWTSSEVLNEILGIDSNYVKTFESWSELVHPDFRERMIDYFFNEVVKEKKKFNKEYKVIRNNDGQEIWVSGLGELE